ncbi:MAG: DUF72 domain-containing protein [Acidobacteriia bacterium]|nr:DUF72 domain-containing protein [Terriglobia bacterium]
MSLARYAQNFSVVEIQQTFYQPPLLPTLAKWRAAVPAEFEFTLKAWQLITHEASSPTYRRLREKLSDQQRREAGSFRLNATVRSAWKRTLDCARALGSRVVLFQCPARFGPSAENKARLREFFREIRRELPGPRAEGEFTFVWEPRGQWTREDAGELCEELGLVHGVDPFEQPPATPGLGYFRLHGKAGYRYRYSDEDLHRLAELTGGHNPCYVLFNNLSMLEDARRFACLARGGA